MVFEVELFRNRYAGFEELIQFNQIHGKLHTIRGIHFSPEPIRHWKVLACLEGQIREVVVDMRLQSKTFGKIEFIDLRSDDSKTLIIPPGFGHGVQSLTEGSLTVYGTNVPYRLNQEISLNPLSTQFSSVWEYPNILSERDAAAPTFENYISGLDSIK